MAQQVLVARKMVSIVVPLLMVTALLTVGPGSQGVSSSASGDRSFCSSDELLSESLRANPDLQKTLDAQEEAIRNYAENPSSRRNKLRTTAASNYIIPVVVYVIHQGGPENITDQQVTSQISALNTAFSGHGIEFCLATQQGVTPLPPPTPGIIRIVSPLTAHLTSQESSLKALSSLPGDRYLRIWVVKDIDNNSGVVGYARFPGTVPTALEGIVMRYDVFGNAATCGCSNLLPNYDQGKILAHEAGHYLNLFHTFQGGCSGMFPSDCATAGDRVCDTPQTATANTGCPVVGAVFSCDGTPAPIDNHMNYTDDTCRVVFKPGQETRMLATLNTIRQLLVSPQNQVFTGVQCAGQLNAAFAANDSNPCINTPVTFTAVNNAGAAYNWNFGDGNTGIGNPITHTYMAAGTYTVTLTVSSGANSVSSSSQVFVTACPPIHSNQGNWYFAAFAGLNFSSGVPMADLNGKLMKGDGEGTVTQSDPNGNLLFYSDGVEVYDRNHTLMNPGSPLNGNTSNAQACISVPDPANPNRYYLFTMGPFDGGSARLWYTLVDLTTPPGTLTHINTQVVSGGLAEELTAVPHCNGSDYWVIVNTGNAFYAYLVTAAGISGPVVSTVTVPGFPAYGSLKASPDGTMIAQSILGGDSGGCCNVSYSAVFDFNKATGVIVLRYVLAHGNYGASFSPDSQLLYVSERGGAVYQYDLTLPNPNVTVPLVGQVPGLLVSLQLGPDHKIYLTSIGRSFLAVINSPNQRDTAVQSNAAGFNANGPSLGGRTSAWGLPNMIDALPVAQIPADFSYVVSSCSTVNFTAPPCATYAWSFGDGTTSNAQNPTHTYAINGAYTVKLILNGSTTVTHAITIGLPASAATIFGPSHVCLASGNPPFYNYSANAQPGLTYNWTVTGGSISGISGSDNVDVVWTTLPGTVKVTVTDPAVGCTATKTLTVIQNCNPNQCVPPPSDMVNWWTFDETSGTTAQDRAGSVNNAGAYKNSPTPVAGVVAGALYFNGVNNWVEVANQTEVNFLGGCVLDGAEPMTIDLWVKTDIQPGTGPTSGLLTILDKRVNPNNPTGYHLFLFNGRLGFQIDGINYVAPATGLDYVDVADNQWHFAAVSLPMCRGIEGGFLYVDGKTVLTLPRGLGFDNTATLYIGRRDPNFMGNFFKGSLDELEMFKRALSDDDLRPIFEARSLGKCKVNCTPVFPNGCPAVTATAHASCPYATSTVVNYAIPIATGNCSTVTVSCNPPPGSMFPVGTTTVTCTAADVLGNTAQCTFTVTVFSFCLQDETNPGNVVLINALTGNYSFCCNGVLIASGKGTLTTKGCIGSIDHIPGDRRVHIQWDTSANSGAGAGTAYVQKPGAIVCQITDKKMSNNSCQCF